MVDASSGGARWDGPGEGAMRAGHLLADAQHLISQLRAALDRTAIIDQAVGVLMSRSGSTSPEALGRLRTRSELENRPLLSVAQSVLAEAAGERAVNLIGSEKVGVQPPAGGRLEQWRPGLTEICRTGGAKFLNRVSEDTFARGESILGRFVGNNPAAGDLRAAAVGDADSGPGDQERDRPVYGHGLGRSWVAVLDAVRCRLASGARVRRSRHPIVLGVVARCCGCQYAFHAARQVRFSPTFSLVDRDLGRDPLRSRRAAVGERYHP